jgi:signal recognition particle GTPase
MILNFDRFIKEELRISQTDNKTLSVLKQNIKDRLLEYKTYLLSNIEVINNEVIYKTFDELEKRTIMRELNNEFTKELIEELNIEGLIDDLESIYSKREIYIKKKIRNKFKEYFQYLESV